MTEEKLEVVLIKRTIFNANLCKSILPALHESNAGLLTEKKKD